MYSHTFLTASVRETSGAPTNLDKTGDTGTGFLMPVDALAFAADEAEASGGAFAVLVVALAVAIRALNLPKTL